MPDRRQTSLKFPLEETVWFEKGQEVRDLISISLDPKVTINNDDDFVILKGSLDLSGEYYLSLKETESQDPVGNIVIQNVEVRTDDLSMFFHSFPVDITIPKNRIGTEEEIEIYIESFDYELTKGNKLRILAEVSIHGIYEDVEEEAEVLAEEEPAHDEREEDLDLNDVETGTDDVTEEFSDRIDQEENLETNEILEEDITEITKSQSQEIYEPFYAEARMIPEDHVAEEINEKSPATIPQLPKVILEQIPERAENDTVYSEEGESSSIMLVESSSYDYESSSISSEEDIVETKKKKKKDKYESISFADFFARKEEESSSKMRICFVQQGDSLETLAKKYELSVQQIVRANRLDSTQELYEGQVLYIPVKPVRALRKE